MRSFTSQIPEKESLKDITKESSQLALPLKKEGGVLASHWQSELLMNTIVETLEF